MNAKILVVDDEPDAISLIEYNLKAAGYRVAIAADGAQALKKVRTFLPDLLVLDLMLPEIDGLEVCKILRRDPEFASLPILMLTAKAGEIDRVLGLEVGADDYLTKPFSPRELILRIKSILGRARTKEDDSNVYRCGDIMIDMSRHVVTAEEKQVSLTFTEVKLLVALISRRGRVQSRERLLRDVWEYETHLDTRTVDTHMRRLRQKLGPSARHLSTVRGVGYRAND